MTRPQLGPRIRALRETLSLNQEQLAERAGITHSYLSMIERGDRTPHVETLVSLAKALGIAVSQLLLDANEPRASLVLRTLIRSRRISMVSSSNSISRRIRALCNS